MLKIQKILPQLRHLNQRVMFNHRGKKTLNTSLTGKTIDDFEITLKLKYLESQLLQLTKRLQTLENDIYYPDYESHIYPHKD